eukprot:GFUD01060354.1.p1 GENE.GFUD01060354.1~~GFUD01060354.1.p1  ORF type:complete len:110 (+),score=9.85 GFUD01060354.1:37-366(+)
MFYIIRQAFQSLLFSELPMSPSSLSTLSFEATSLTANTSMCSFSAFSMSDTLLLSTSSPPMSTGSFSLFCPLIFCLLTPLECLNDGGRLPDGPLARVLFGFESCSVSAD